MIHYELSPQERTQITGRWHDESAALCNTGDGHRLGVNPAEFSGAGNVDGKVVAVDCPNCCARKNLVAPRERNRVLWRAPDASALA